MEPTIRADITGAMLLFNMIKGPWMRAAVQEGVGKAAHRTEEVMRQSLWSMVYATPEGDYVRTGRLANGTHAAKPGVSHANDDSTALRTDMHNDDPMAIVKVTGLEFSSEIGNWVSYAYFVHEGLGRGNRGPKPFSSQANLVAPTFLSQEVNSAIAAILVAMAI